MISFILFTLFGTLLCDWNWPLAVTDCPHEKYVGTWTFYETSQDFTESNIFDNCLPNTNVSSLVKTETVLELQYPNIVKDKAKGTSGTFTSLANSGFEIRINQKRYILFFFYEIVGPMKIVTFCNRTWTGWITEDVTMKPKHFGCVYGIEEPKPLNQDSEKMEEKTSEEVPYFDLSEEQTFYNNQVSRQRSPESLEILNHNYEFYQNNYPQKCDISNLPEEFDWRNVDGQNFISPVKNQEQCGSCYIFATTGMLESRSRIQSNNTFKPILSEQDIMNCGSPLLFGCGGGLDLLVEKYIGWFGSISSQCVPYVGKTHECSGFSKNCSARYFLDKYEYIGGYFGGTTEENMMKAIYENGPISGQMLVEKKFEKYTGGVYECEKHKYGDSDHQILIIGWGVEKNNEKYWLCKNSWGDWGPMDGFFKIKRGENDCNIEVAATQANLYVS